MIIKCIVACLNSNGERDLYFVKIKCTEEQYNLGQHYEEAQTSAEEEGYDPALVFDENDPGGRAMLPLFAWESASVLEVAE